MSAEALATGRLPATGLRIPQTRKVPSPLVSGPAFTLARARLWLRVAWLALGRAQSPAGAWGDLRALLGRLKRGREDRRPVKAARLAQGITFDLFAPPFPSPAFDRFIEGELRRLDPSREGPAPLQVAFLAITRRCGLACEHCFEGENLNKPESLDLAKLQALLEEVARLGATQVFLSGGEPLARGQELVELVRSAPRDLEVWLITAGQGLRTALAHELRLAGLRGLVISFDHWDPECHDAFRGRPGTFRRAAQAARTARESGLEVALSLCPTRVFLAREENLWRYADLARELGAGFVQVAEPSAKGHFEGRDVELDAPALARLEAFYEASQFDPAHRHLPVFSMPKLMGRRFGCTGGGERFLYMDPGGGVHACPFCKGDAGSILSHDLDVLRERLRLHGCPAEACAAARTGSRAAS